MIRFIKVSSGSILGIEAYRVFVEIVLTFGNSEHLTLSGLPDPVIKESKTRVRAAIELSNLPFPKDTIIINLSPANLKKEGSFYDLAIAAGILAAQFEISQDLLDETIIIGELSLNGTVIPLRGVLPMVILAKKLKYKRIIVPYDNFAEASFVNGVQILAVKHIQDVILFFRGELEPKDSPPRIIIKPKKSSYDFQDIIGQTEAKRALEISACGKHNLFLMGPPGAGKTMLARRLPGILPSMTEDEVLSTSEIYSIAGLLDSVTGLMKERPFRAPHHSISYAGLVGGGSFPRPGEVSLANNGVLFLDEFLEFKKTVLEVLRQPLEHKSITISRAAASLTFKCDFLLITATNPCPCGNLGSENKHCRCSPRQISSYKSKLSSPLSDRIDIKVRVPALNMSDLLGLKKGESSSEILKRVAKVREIQIKRFKNEFFKYNSDIPDSLIFKYCQLTPQAKRVLEKAADNFKFSARSFNKIIKLSRTISDLSASPEIDEEHIAESIFFNKEIL